MNLTTNHLISLSSVLVDNFKRLASRDDQNQYPAYHTSAVLYHAECLPLRALLRLHNMLDKASSLFASPFYNQQLARQSNRARTKGFFGSNVVRGLMINHQQTSVEKTAMASAY